MSVASFMCCLLLALPLVSAFSILDLLAKGIPESQDLWYPEVCYADKKIVNDRIYFALHNWRRSKDSDVIICQIKTVLEARHGITTEYNECVDKLAMEKFADNLIDHIDVKSGKPTLEWKEIKKAVEHDFRFTKTIAECSRKLEHCADVHFLRDCTNRHSNPFVA